MLGRASAARARVHLLAAYDFDLAWAVEDVRYRFRGGVPHVAEVTASGLMRAAAREGTVVKRARMRHVVSFR
jgi:hypothetical protein